MSLSLINIINHINLSDQTPKIVGRENKRKKKKNKKTTQRSKEGGGGKNWAENLISQKPLRRIGDKKGETERTKKEKKRAQLVHRSRRG